MPYLVLVLIPLSWLAWCAVVQPYDPSMSAFVMLAAEWGTAVLLSRIYRRNRP